jgi:hypothetical protein
MSVTSSNFDWLAIRLIAIAPKAVKKLHQVVNFILVESFLKRRHSAPAVQYCLPHIFVRCRRAARQRLLEE